MVQDNDKACFTVKYKDGDFICDVDRSDSDSLEQQEVDKRTDLANKILGIIRAYYPNASDICIEVTSDDSRNTVGFTSDGTPINVIWGKWGDEHYLVYLSEIDAVTRRFIEQYPANEAPEIPGYPYVTAIPTLIPEILHDIMDTANHVWSTLTNSN